MAALVGTTTFTGIRLTRRSHILVSFDDDDGNKCNNNSNT